MSKHADARDAAAVSTGTWKARDERTEEGEKGQPRTHCEPRGMVPVETVTRGIAIRVKFVGAGGGGGGTGLMETVW